MCKIRLHQILRLSHCSTFFHPWSQQTWLHRFMYVCLCKSGDVHQKTPIRNALTVPRHSSLASNPHTYNWLLEVVICFIAQSSWLLTSSVSCAPFTYESMVTTSTQTHVLTFASGGMQTKIVNGAWRTKLNSRWFLRNSSVRECFRKHFLQVGHQCFCHTDYKRFYWGAETQGWKTIS